MTKTRIEIFTDGVLAILMTILILELRHPKTDDWLGLWDVAGKLFVYLVSFVMIAAYWNNHHHMFQVVHKINGRVLWANNLFMFALAWFPFGTAWLGDFLGSLAPQITYGIITLFSNLAYLLLAKELIRANGVDSQIAQLFDSHRKSYISICLNVLGLFLGWLVHPYFTLIVNIVILFIWLVPDKRIENHYKEQ